MYSNLNPRIRDYDHVFMIGPWLVGRLVQRGRVFVITHGDVYDFLHIPLEGTGPLSWVLGPRDVYGFYDWVYRLDKELVAAFDRAVRVASCSPGSPSSGANSLRHSGEGPGTTWSSPVRRPPHASRPRQR